jgi:hypothetical protein
MLPYIDTSSYELRLVVKVACYVISGADRGAVVVASSPIMHKLPILQIWSVGILRPFNADDGWPLLCCVKYTDFEAPL